VDGVDAGNGSKEQCNEEGRRYLELRAWVQVARVGRAEESSVFVWHETGWTESPSALELEVTSSAGRNGFEAK